MLDHVLLIVNPTAGKEKAIDYSYELKGILEKTYQSQVVIRCTDKEGDAVVLGKEARQNGFDTVITLGGDGTVSETIEGIMDSQDKPFFAFIPLGTVNDLGRAIGYSMNPREVIQSFSQLQESSIDVGKINNQFFINVIAIGPIAESVVDTSSDDKSRLGKLAYIKDGVQGFFTDQAYQLEIIDSEKRVYSIETNLLIIGLTNSVGGFDKIFPKATYNDGYLYLAAVKGHTPLDMLEATVNLGFHQYGSDKLLLLRDHAYNIKSLDNERIITNVDGDLGPELPIKIQIFPRAIKVLISL